MKHRIAIEKLKRDARFAVGLDLEQVNHLIQQVQPIADAIEHLVAERQLIRADSRLSSAGQNADIKKATDDAVDKIAEHAAKLSRESVITDLRQRVSTKVTGSRTKAAEGLKDAPLLAQELRQAVLPRLIKQGEAMQIPASRTVEKMVLRAAESFGTNPAKAEAVIAALSVGWPFCPDLPEGALDQINTVIAGQVAAEEQQALVQAEAVQGLIDFVVNVSVQSIKEMA